MEHKRALGLSLSQRFFIPPLCTGTTLLSLSDDGKMLFFGLRLKIWANGKLISMATDFSSFIEMPSMSKLDFD